MSLSGDIRVKTDSRYKDIYNELRNVAVGDMHEIFFLCACLGYKAGAIKDLGSSGDEKFWSRTFTPDEYACFYAMVLEKRNMDLAAIADDKVVISEMEKYANAGMEILIKDFLDPYLIKKDTLLLDSSAKKNLPKELLHFVFERIA